MSAWVYRPPYFPYPPAPRLNPALAASFVPTNVVAFDSAAESDSAPVQTAAPDDFSDGGAWGDLPQVFAYPIDLSDAGADSDVTGPVSIFATADVGTGAEALGAMDLVGGFDAGLLDENHDLTAVFLLGVDTSAELDVALMIGLTAFDAGAASPFTGSIVITLPGADSAAAVGTLLATTATFTVLPDSGTETEWLGPLAIFGAFDAGAASEFAQQSTVFTAFDSGAGTDFTEPTVAFARFDSGAGTDFQTQQITLPLFPDSATSSNLTGALGVVGGFDGASGTGSDWPGLVLVTAGFDHAAGTGTATTVNLTASFSLFDPGTERETILASTASLFELEAGAGAALTQVNVFAAALFSADSAGASEFTAQTAALFLPDSGISAAGFVATTATLFALDIGGGVETIGPRIFSPVSFDAGAFSETTLALTATLFELDSGATSVANVQTASFLALDSGASAAGFVATTATLFEGDSATVTAAAPIQSANVSAFDAGAGTDGFDPVAQFSADTAHLGDSFLALSATVFGADSGAWIETAPSGVASVFGSLSICGYFAANYFAGVYFAPCYFPPGAPTQVSGAPRWRRSSQLGTNRTGQREAE